MTHSIEHTDGQWHGKLHRINQDGKRRIMVFSSELHKMLGVEYPKHRDWLSAILIRTGLRDGIDYQHGRNHSTGDADTHLSISAVQAVLVGINTDLSWKYHNQLSDLINRGFSSETKHDHAAHQRSGSRVHSPNIVPAKTTGQFEPSRRKRRD